MRQKRGISLRQLEAMTGINRADLSRMENRGLQPRDGEFDRVIAALMADPLAPAAELS